MRVTAILGLLFLFTWSCSSTRDPAKRSPAPIPTPEMLAAGHPPETCRITFWEDGDTPTVACAGSEEPVVIRMIGIDTAESGFDENSRNRARRQVDLWGMTLEQVYTCGKAATRRVRELCPTGSEVEVIGTERGKYGRRLAYVICKGVNLNLRLVEEGLAGHYPYPGQPEKPAACPLPEAETN
jgi:endonuclease YncB( thermonuclease family)